MATKAIVAAELRPGTGDPRGMNEGVPAADSPVYWESLCIWLTNELKDVSATLVRLEQNTSRLESHSHPVESVTTRLTPNGVRTIAIALRINGQNRTFEIAGPNSVSITRNSAGRVTTVAIRNYEGAIVLHLCGPLPVSCAPSANAWGE